MSADRITAQYLPLLATEWGVVALLRLLGQRPGGTPLAVLIGRQEGTRRLAGDVTLALLGWLVVTVVELAWPGRIAADILPVSVAEKLVWIAVALTAAFVEELLFRGYLQRRLTTLTGSVLAGVTFQAALFALVHGEQGLQAAAKAGIYGLGLGAMAHLRRSLRPGILCHAAIDLLSGLCRV